jgi:hypothetical protein
MMFIGTVNKRSCDLWSQRVTLVSAGNSTRVRLECVLECFETCSCKSKEASS